MPTKLPKFFINITVLVASLQFILIVPAAKAKDSAEQLGNVNPQQEMMPVIKKNLGSMRGCYEILLKKNPKAEGKVVTEWFILRSGKVDKPSINMSSIKDTPFRSCIIKTLAKWEFSPHNSDKPVKVTYPFIFNPL